MSINDIYGLIEVLACFYKLDLGFLRNLNVIEEGKCILLLSKIVILEFVKIQSK